MTRLTAQDSASVKTLPRVSWIVINGDSTIRADHFSVPGSTRQYQLFFDHRNNNIGFIVEPEGYYEYRFFLEGFDKKPNRWQKSGFKEYTNLPSGKYALRSWFREKDNAGREMKPVYFTVRPLWYMTIAARFLYIFFLILIIWSIYKLFKIRLIREKLVLEQIINRKTSDLLAEKEKSEKLLANVLPKTTADEIMAKGKATKTKYNFVTVLFSDIQGFTQIAEELNPEILIDELDKFFFHFDTVVEKYRIEKIKTIGDAYMCAGGIPERNRTNPVEVILAALEMQDYMKKLKETSIVNGMKYWDIRIGIHTGTVIAGVVGHKKLSYDIWGDTVNTASRMESSGEAGRINISGTTYEFVKDFFVCRHRGKMPVKYKGELDMYFVEGILPDLRGEDGLPNEKFRFKMQVIKLQDVEDVVDKIFSEEAPPDLYFHNVSFARNITNQTDLIAIAEKLPEEEYISLKLASVFIETGYVSDYERPAEAALALMEEVLPRFGFDRKYVDGARQLILNAFNEEYQSHSDKILHDARYDYLGRVDYIRLTDKLLKERNKNGMPTSNREWKAIQLELLARHDFLTDTGRLLRSVSVEEQVDALDVYGD